jgi:16S rRNA (uracil1498-N3)-methyltransferase
MSLPLFYLENIGPPGSVQMLPEESSRHIVQVLRMTSGEQMKITDGLGNVAVVVIVDDHKKKCAVKIASIIAVAPPARQHTIAISLLKNNTRFEWFLEKAAELGLCQVIPLITARTEKQHFRYDRMKSILISAMLQSQQAWLTDLWEPVLYTDFMAGTDPATTSAVSKKQARTFRPAAGDRKFIAHCEEAIKSDLLPAIAGDTSAKTLLIGPEGDFTKEEIAIAINHGFEPISLGETRLRTETAGLVAATLLQLS